MLSNLKDMNICIGIKQSRRALEEGVVKKAFVAADADASVTRAFVADCKALGVELETVETMAALGRSAGIDIGATVVTVLAQ